MVIDKSESRDIQKKNEERLNRNEDEIKEGLLSELRKESVAIVTLAYMYAKNFEESGTDITQRWATLQMQNEALQQAYNRGYKDALREIKKSEKKGEKKGRKK